MRFQHFPLGRNHRSREVCMSRSRSFRQCRTPFIRIWRTISPPNQILRWHGSFQYMEPLRYPHRSNSPCDFARQGDISP